MLFSSITFLYYFLPITMMFYFLVPKVLKNSVLLVASLIFYGWGEPKYIILMILSVFFGYLFGIWMERQEKRERKLLLCGISVTISLSFLLYFKYAGFFVENFSKVTGMPFGSLRIALPIGISFYTFQLISYTVDVYRGEKAQKNIFHLATYIAMFPQLIAGPIVRYSDIAKELKMREHSLSLMGEGFRRFILGLSKKILLANQLGELCRVFRDSQEKSLLFYWIYALAFTLHIYFDFSGYSDMAIGLGKVFGFHFSENFNYPYMAKSITEFWRRWHISLGTWFRDYVYIPLGGNRGSFGRQIFNVFAVWFLTGFWHGAEWNFMVWGLFFAVFLMFEKMGFLNLLNKKKFFSSIYVLFLVMVSFVIFNAGDMGEVISDLSGMFGLSGEPLVSKEAIYALKSFWFVLFLAMLGSTPYPKRLFEKLSETDGILRMLVSVAEPIVLLLLMLVMTGYLADGSFNPFLYFRF